jgi:hypothetical protein
MKWDSANGWIACDVVVSVDDLRGSGPTIELTWRLSRVVASQLQYLEIQEASRTRRPPTRGPGAWAGGVFWTTSTEVNVSVSQDKWEKAKTLINSLWSMIENAGAYCEDFEPNSVTLNYKDLEITRGFLVHLSMTLDMLTHHLKGFHLALAAHLPRRNEEGWKLTDSEWMSFLLCKVEQGLLRQTELDLLSTKGKTEQYTTPPVSLQLIPHLRDDIFALHKFFLTESPPVVQDWRNHVHLLLYGFADASGGGLGSTASVPGSGI